MTGNVNFVVLLQQVFSIFFFCRPRNPQFMSRSRHRIIASGNSVVSLRRRVDAGILMKRLLHQAAVIE